MLLCQAFHRKDIGVGQSHTLCCIVVVNAIFLKRSVVKCAFHYQGQHISAAAALIGYDVASRYLLVFDIFQTGLRKLAVKRGNFLVDGGGVSRIVLDLRHMIGICISYSLTVCGIAFLAI